MSIDWEEDDKMWIDFDGFSLDEKDLGIEDTNIICSKFDKGDIIRFKGLKGKVTEVIGIVDGHFEYKLEFDPVNSEDNKDNQDSDKKKNRWTYAKEKDIELIIKMGRKKACTCGAKHTSNPKYHLSYCKLSNEQQFLASFERMLDGSSDLKITENVEEIRKKCNGDFWDGV